MKHSSLNKIDRFSLMLAIILLLVPFFINHNLQVACLALYPIYLLLVIFYSRQHQIPLSRLVLIALISLLCVGLNIISGAFLTPYNRLFANILVSTVALVILLEYLAINMSKLFTAYFLLILPLFAIYYIPLLRFADSNFKFLAVTPIILSFIPIAYVYVKQHKLFLWIVVCIVGVSVSYIVYPQYLYATNGKKIKVNEETFGHIKLINPEEQLVVLDSLPQDIIILDLWYSRCAACYAAFPNLQDLFQQYKNNPRVLIATVNLPYKDDHMLDLQAKMKPYTFPQFKLANGTVQKNPFNVQRYPTTLIFNAQKQLIYNGLINYNSGINSVHDIITQETQ